MTVRTDRLPRALGLLHLLVGLIAQSVGSNGEGKPSRSDAILPPAVARYLASSVTKKLP